MSDINAISAWVFIAAGVLVGCASGLLFHRETWLGGYGSWRRRLVRLAHISFFGIGLLNLAYALTIHSLHWPSPPVAVSVALAVAGILMPGACYLAAWRIRLRHLFVVPVSCVLIAVVGLLLRRALP